jgi:hypothetical protein
LHAKATLARFETGGLRVPDCMMIQGIRTLIVLLRLQRVAVRSYLSPSLILWLPVLSSRYLVKGMSMSQQSDIASKPGQSRSLKLPYLRVLHHREES